MPSVTINEKMVFFAHCPKSGGTSIEHYLAERYPPLRLVDRKWGKKWRFCGETRRARIRSSPQHMTWEDALSVLPSKPDHVFTVVRDPVARLISEYKFHRTLRGTGRVGRLLRQLDFSTWLRVVLRAARQDPFLFDNHLRAQHEFIPESGAVVFRLEDGLEKVSVWLAGLEAGEREAGVIEHKLASRAPRRGLRPSRQDLELIARTYAADYELFGYSLPDPTTAPPDRLAPLRDAFAATLAPLIPKLYAGGYL